MSAMNELLSGRIAVVTGAGRGVGAAIAEALARAGASVVLAARTASDLEAVKARIETERPAAAGAAPGVLCVPTDVADEAQVKRFAATVGEAYGRLDILVNNAGIARRAPLAETTTAEWDRHFAVNARGPFLMCRECLGLLRAAGGGFIVNIASVVGVKGYVEQAAYTASKHALMGMTKVLAQEVQADGVRVHVICPGGVATPMVSEMRPDLDPAVLIAPEEIADLVLFLVTRSGNAVIDQVNVRRASSSPWF